MGVDLTVILIHRNDKTRVKLIDVNYRQRGKIKDLHFNVLPDFQVI